MKFCPRCEKPVTVMVINIDAREYGQCVNGGESTCNEVTGAGLWTMQPGVVLG